MNTQQQQRPDTLLATLHVPFVTDDCDYQVHTIVGKIDQGVLTIGGDYTPEQKAAMNAYFTYNNEHLRERRGNSLTVMSEEQQALYNTAIESLKSTHQKLRERVEKLLLDHYQCEENCEARMGYYEEHENYTYYLEEYVKDGELASDAPANMWCYHEWRQSGKLPEGSRLFECSVREGYGEWYLERRYREPLRVTNYWVTLSLGGDLAIIHSIRDKRSWKRAEEED